MPNHKSAIKRTRQNKKRHARNSAVRSHARTAVRKVRAAILSGNKEEAATSLKEATSILDKSSSKGVHHENNTARRVSRLALQVNKMP